MLILTWTKRKEKENAEIKIYGYHVLLLSWTFESLLLYHECISWYHHKLLLIALHIIQIPNKIWKT